MTVDPKAIARALIGPSVVPQVPNALQVPAIPMPPRQQVAQGFSLGPMQGHGGGARYQTILDPTGNIVGLYTTNTTPFSKHKIIPYVNGEADHGNTMQFNSRAQALGSIGIGQ